MKIRFLIPLLLVLALGLTSCGAETIPEKPPEAAPPETAQPEEPPPETDPAGTDSPEETALPPLEGTPLTAEELAQADEAFNCYGHPGDKAQELGCFFTSSYEDVTELDFEAFLQYYFVESAELGDGDVEEFQALAALPDFPWDAEDLERWGNVPSGLPVPVHRIPRAAVDQTLETYAGITAAGLKDTSGILYLSDYDSYYNFTSDYGPGAFQPVEGVRDGDTVRLRSGPAWGNGGEVIQELALREEEGRWLIQSFNSYPVENGWPS